MMTMQDLQSRRAELHATKLALEAEWAKDPTPEKWSAVTLANDALAQADSRLRIADEADRARKAEEASAAVKAKRETIAKTREDCHADGYLRRHAAIIESAAKHVVAAFADLDRLRDAAHADARRLEDAKAMARELGDHDLERSLPEPLMRHVFREAIGTEIGRLLGPDGFTRHVAGADAFDPKRPPEGWPTRAPKRTKGAPDAA